MACVRIVTTICVFLFAATSFAQQQRTASTKDLVGTWMVVSSTGVRPDGTKVNNFGGNATGQLMFDDAGHFSLQQMGDARLKFASNDRNQGTPEENKGAVQGALAFFGTYTVDPAGPILVLHIDRSTFPNWDGVEQKRPFTIANDEMTWIVPSNTSGLASGQIIFRRVK